MAYVTISFELGKGYIASLQKRMKQYKISQGELARTMGMGEFGATYVSRYFTKNPDRRISPTMEMVERIEEAMLKLQRARDAQERKLQTNRKGASITK